MAHSSEGPRTVTIHESEYGVTEEIDRALGEADPINPSHYKLGGVEVIDAIDAWGLNFCRGNAVKYLARAGKKDPTKVIEDLRKAVWYIEHEIAELKKS